MRENWVRSLGWEDPLEKEMTTHSSTLAWKIPWTKKPGRLQSMGSQRVGHNWATSLRLCHCVWGSLLASRLGAKEGWEQGLSCEPKLIGEEEAHARRSPFGPVLGLATSPWPMQLPCPLSSHRCQQLPWWSHLWGPHVWHHRRPPDRLGARGHRGQHYGAGARLLRPLSAPRLQLQLCQQPICPFCVAPPASPQHGRVCEWKKMCACFQNLPCVPTRERPCAALRATFSF